MQRIGVVVGMQLEARLAKHLRPVAIETSGATFSGTKLAVERLLKTQVDAVISFGFAAGLDPLVKPGSIMLPRTIRVGIKDYTPDATLRLKLGAGQCNVKIGTLLHSNEVIKSTVEKKRLFQNTFCMAADMESGIVAEYCQRNNVPFAVLRVICDPALRNLPPIACSALSQSGNLNFFTILSNLLKNPLQILELISLGFEAGIAYWCLRRYVYKIADTISVI